MPLREHLIELRNRLFKAGLALLAGSVVGWFLYDPVLESLARPLFELQIAAPGKSAENTGQPIGAQDPAAFARKQEDRTEFTIELKGKR